MNRMVIIGPALSYVTPARTTPHDVAPGKATA
ncbi:hypothetical protein SAMN05428985_106426 [Nocardioides sp. YR527]|nr:hypothetical protein SAMN05428985_106426 [Nocardioides sp. YR527]